MKSKMTYAVVLASAIGIWSLAAPASNAQISSTGPFVGTLQESFEGFKDFVTNLPTVFEPSPASVFGGAATLSESNVNHSLFVFKPSTAVDFRLWSSGPDAMPNQGLQGMGVANTNDDSIFTFSGPIVAFGGYFGARTGTNPLNENQSVADPATFAISFFDVFNNQVGATQNWTYSRTGFADGLLEWHGFTSTSAFSKVVVSSPNTLYAYDNLQATSVPEPGVMVSLIGAGTVGGMFVIRRRRRQA